MRLPLLACVFAPVLFAANPDKKLIEFGWDSPDTAFMRAHVAEMEQTPFDGTVFYVKYQDGKTTGSFLHDAWGSRAFTQSQLQPAIDDLKSTPFKKFTENFLRIDVTPGNVDWFDDFTPILNNMKLAALIAKEGGCRGILFDNEMYAAELWNYSKQRDAKTKTFDAYRKQVHQRGREVMQAFQESYPDIPVMFTYGYTLLRYETNDDASKLPTASYSLWPAFLDGMLEEAKGKTQLIDGFEISYPFQTVAEFEKGRKHFEKDITPYLASADLYHSRFTLGFGIWIDENWRKRGWDVEHPDKNYFTPQKLEAATTAAMKISDRYVWIYTEKPQWWSAAGKSEAISPEYADALRRAKAAAAK